MNNNPLVSVVICEHNTKLEYLEKAIESMLSQTYSNFEIVFVDDCSSTDYMSLKAMSDPRIKIIKNKVNLGLAASRNIGIDASQGKYIAIMDTDDISHCNRLEKQVEFMENNVDVAVCGTWFNMFGDKSGTIKRIIDDNDYYRCCLFFDNSPAIINPSTMIRKSVLDKNNIRLNEKLKSAEDYELWIKISKFGRVTNLKEVLLDYRIRKGQMSDRFRSKDIGNNGWIVLKEQLGELGFIINDKNEKFLKLNYLKKEVNPYKYFKYLKELSTLNLSAKVFDQFKFDKRIRKQWVNKIYSIKNPFSILKLLFQLPFKEKWFLIKKEFARLNRRRIKQEETKEITVCE